MFKKNTITIIFLLCSVVLRANGADSLEQDLMRAQIEYYKSQVRPKKFFESVSPALPGIIGTMIGASLALFGVRWSNKRQWDLEKEKWEMTKKDEATKEVRSAVANMSKIIAAELQAIIWLTWIGKYEPHILSDKDIDDYNIEMKQLFRDALVAQAYLAALDLGLHTKMKSIAKEVSRIDHKMSFTIQKIKQAANPDERIVAAKELEIFYDESYFYHDNLAEKIGNALPPLK